MQLVKYPRVLSVKPSNKVYIHISKVKNGEKAKRNHGAYAAWAFSAKLQKINTKG